MTGPRGTYTWNMRSRTEVIMTITLYIYLFLLLSTVGAFQPNIATCILLDPYLTGLTHYYCRSNSPEAGLPGSGSGVFFMFMFTS